jgi:hypothetical protein
MFWYSPREKMSSANLRIFSGSLRSLRLRGEEITGKFHRRDEEDAEEA